MKQPHPSEPLIFKGFCISCAIAYSVIAVSVVVKIVVNCGHISNVEKAETATGEDGELLPPAMRVMPSILHFVIL
jgi:hypothetical protein